MKSNIKVLLGSPIRQKREILKEFLSGIEQLSRGDLLRVNYFFIDDNIEEESSQLLERFAERNTNTIIRRIETGQQKLYQCNENTHIWEEDLIWKVAEFKNLIIDKAIKDDYDYLFLVDSDLVMHPKTLEHLVSVEKDIVSEIFWTKWEPDFPELPQVWIYDQYTLYKYQRGESLDQGEILNRVQNFINQLRIPGVYPVGGLGACTLISKKSLLSGVNFNEVYNVSFIGEDRHFCIRAATLGFRLYVDTYYPAYHIYRLSDLERFKSLKSTPFS